MQCSLALKATKVHSVFSEKNNRRYIHVLNYLLGNTFREKKTYNDIVNWVIQTFVIMSTLCRVSKVDGCVVWMKVCQLVSSLLVKVLDPFVLGNFMVDLREFVFLQEGNGACSIPYVIP